MTQDLFPQHWLTNTLLDDGFITQKAGELLTRPIPYALEAWLKEHFDAVTLAARNEAQLEEKFIAPLLARLGWSKAYQVGITVQGKFAKPDYCLVLRPEQEDGLIASKDHALITAICESKAWDKTLDTGKADRKDNPHHQLQDYLYRLPMPQPTDDEIRSNPDYAQLAKNALLLSLAASWDDFAELAPLFEVQPQDLPQTAKAQDTLRAQNDKAVARLYGITDAELAHVLRSFKVMTSKRSEYLTLLN